MFPFYWTLVELINTSDSGSEEWGFESLKSNEWWFNSTSLTEIVVNSTKGFESPSYYWVEGKLRSFQSMV